MAQFKISMKNQHGITVLTDYDTMRTTGGLTFDEQLNLNVDGSSLNFSMLKYLYEASNKAVNTPAISITYGTVIQLILNDYRYDFAVTSIDYQFLSENLQLSFSTQDLFQFETSRLGIGYTITADTTDSEYLGAQPIDYWARKIVTENNLNWSYVGIDQLNNDILANYNTKSVNETRSQVSQEQLYHWLELPKNNYATLNNSVSFECSDSNAYNALKQLANDNELFIWVDYSGRNFGFVPLKNPIFNGYYFNPNNNLQSFSLRGDGGNLITVLNVTGPQDINDQEITLVPDIPGDVATYIQTDDWENSIYYPNMYNNITQDTTFLNQIEYTPWFENKLINIDFFTQDNLLTLSEKQDIEYTLYNDLRRTNGRMITSWSTYITQCEQDLMNINQNEINVESLMASIQADNETVYDAIKNNNLIAIAYTDPTTFTKYASVLIPDGYLIDVTIEGYPTYTNIPFQHYNEPDIIEAPIAATSVCYADSVRDDNTKSFHYAQGSLLPPSTVTKLLCGSVTLENNIPVINDYELFNTDNGGFGAYSITQRITDPFNFLLCGRQKIIIGYQDPVYRWIPTYCGFRISITGSLNSRSYSGTISIFLNNNGKFILPPNDLTNLKILASSSDEVAETTSSITTGNTTWEFTYKISARKNVDPAEISVDRQVLGGFNFQFTTIKATVGDIPLQITSKEINTIYLIPTNTQHTVHLDSNSVGEVGTYQWTDGGVTATIKNTHNSLFLNINRQLVLPSYSKTIPYTQYLTSFYWTGNKVDLGRCAIIKKGPATIQLKRNDGPASYPVVSTTTIDDKLEKNTVQSIYTLQNWYPSLQSNSAHTIADLPNFLNQYCTKYDNYHQLFLENIEKFRNEWERKIIIYNGTTYTVGQLYSTYYKIAILPNGVDLLLQGQLWSSLYTYTINDQDVELWINILKGESQRSEVLRTEVIQYCAQLASKLTEYWNFAYTAAQILGYYLPQDWNCISQLESLSTEYDIKQINYPFYRGNGYNTAPRWYPAPVLSDRFFIKIRPKNDYQHIYKFFDLNNPQNTWPLYSRNQTQLYYEIPSIDDPMLNDTYYQLADATHQANHNDNIKLYYTTNRFKTTLYEAITSPLTAEDYLSNYIPANLDLEPLLTRWIKFLSNHDQYDLSSYYTALTKHNEIWQSLYTKYPGIFRESVYTNETASNSHELYLAARQELDKVSKPEFSYNLTGMDIYMHNSDFLPTRIKLGEQIRIDYQEEDQITTTLNNALREPLFITGIQHTLRDDGDYQFTVTTRSATDTMIQRFAKLLNFNR